MLPAAATTTCGSQHAPASHFSSLLRASSGRHVNGRLRQRSGDDTEKRRDTGTWRSIAALPADAMTGLEARGGRFTVEHHLLAHPDNCVATSSFAAAAD